jgi:cobalt-precorrin-5B (C1)-methyltransferase
MNVSDRSPLSIIRGLTVPPRNPRGTREGYTTGACAAAATQAACRLLERDERPDAVSVPSPLGYDLVIPINRLRYEDGVATAGVVKDAGDDPDVTHGAEVLVTVSRGGPPGTHIRGGAGVGTVTQPGLEVPPGAPAINPVPLRMIADAVVIALGTPHPSPGVIVTVSVVDGENLAKKTLNARIGIIGGLSILGTTGIVRPLSTASWRASVVQAIDVAAANHLDRVVLTTGGRSERFARAIYPALPEMAFVQMGIFTGDSLKRALARGIAAVTISGMIGKLAKLAAGQMQTHVAAGGVDVAFMAGLAAENGAPAPLVQAIRDANTARHVQELVDGAAFPIFYHALGRRLADACHAHADGRLDIEAILFDFEGGVLARETIPSRDAVARSIHNI